MQKLLGNGKLRILLQGSQFISTCIILLLIAALCPDDGNDWVVFGDHCYLRVDTTLAWLAAETHCNGLGGNLATVNTADIWVRFMMKP